MVEFILLPCFGSFFPYNKKFAEVENCETGNLF